MKSLFQKEDHQSILKRIESLNEDSKPQWGKMTVGQMLAHCARSLDVNSGLVEEKKPGFMVRLMRPFIKKMVFGPKDFPKNSPTSPQFKIEEEVSFESGLERFKKSLEHFTHEKNRKSIVNLPSKTFGKLSEDEKGFSMLKHIDHHLRQFGA